MFISCHGLKTLVELLDEDYSEQTELVVHALNGIGSVFELQSPTTKNDFCRMFIREGLLDPLSSALLNVMASRGPSSTEMNKIIQILLVFSQVSQSDIHVRNALGTRKVVR
ncbi:Protein kinase of the Mitotic Exit Network, partial [Paramarasmius palmivorus]